MHVEPVPVPVANVYDVRQVAAGTFYGLALQGDRSVWSWGQASYGAEGTGSNSFKPAKVPIADVVAIAAGGSSSMAKKADGSLWVWGDNSAGQLGMGTVDTDEHQTPIRLNLGFSISDMSTSGGHTMVLRSDGTVWAWGLNDYGQIGTGSTRSVNITTPTQVKNLTNVIAIAARGRHSLAVKADGTVWAWGQNNAGQLGDGTRTAASLPVKAVGLANAVQVGGTSDASVALDSTGDVWTWGSGTSGQSGRPSATAGAPALSSLVPERVPGISNVKMISKSSGSTYAVKTDGTTWAWGDNSDGELGVNDVSYCVYPNGGMPIRCKNTPTQIPGMTNPESIAGGQTFMVVSNGGTHQPPTTYTGEPLTRPLNELFGFWAGQMFMADPVDTATGNFLHKETDLIAQNGAYGLEWERTYNSRNAATGSLSRGWSSSFSESVTALGNGNVVLTKADGRSVTYAVGMGGAYTRPVDELADLSRLPDGSWRLAWFDGNTWTFDAAGRIAAKTSWAGQTATATYDTTGRLQRVDSSTGESLVMTYTDGQLTKVSAGDGREAIYAYAAGILMSAATALSGTTAYTVDSGGFVATITDATGKNVVTNSYDVNGRVLTQIVGAGGSMTTFSYEDAKGTTRVTDAETEQSVMYTQDAKGRLKAAIDATGKVMARTYDAATGFLKTVKNRAGGTTSRTLDARGNVTTVADPNGINKTAAWDSLNRLVVFTDPAKGSRTYAYDGTSRIPSSVTDNTGKTTTFTSAAGLVTSETDPDGVVTSFTYDANRRMTSKTVAPGTPLAATTSYTYDAAGRVLTVTDPLNKTTTYAYDSAGRLLSETDPLNHTTTHTYDAAGRRLTTKDPANHTTVNDYDSSGRLASTTTPRGLKTTYAYDALGQRTASTFPGGTTSTTNSYGAMGRLTSTADELSRATSYEHDEEGRVTRTTDPSGSSSWVSFDDAGRNTATYDGLVRPTSKTTYDTQGRIASNEALGGLVTTYQYDTRGQLWKQTDPRGGVVETLYTAAGRVLSVKDAAGVTTTNTYDAAGRLWKEATPAGETVHEYDLAGRAVKTTTPGALVTTHEYDAAGRLVVTREPGGVVTTYTYTARGEQATVTRSGEGTVSFTYDPDGNLLTVTDANGRTTSYGYDDRNRRTSQTDAAGKTTTWAYDAAGQLKSRTDPLNRVTTYTYDAAGRLATTTDPSGRVETRSYDAAGQLTSVAYGSGTPTTFAYDSAGRRASATDASGTTSFGYEPGGNLASVVRGDGRATRYTYDTAGRRTTMSLPDGTVYRYGYDGLSRLASVVPVHTLADTFTAANASAPDTSKWVKSTAAAGTVSVQGNELSLSAPNTAGSSAQIASTATGADAELTLDYRFGDNNAGAVFQAHVRAGADSYYLEIANDTGVMKLQKKVGATVTTLASGTVPIDLNARRLRLRVEGTALKARVWEAASAEPSMWTLEAADASIAGSGAAKVVFARTKSGHTAFIDNLVFEDLVNPPAAIAQFGYDADGHVTTETLPDGVRTWTWADGRLAGLAQTVPGAPASVAVTYNAAGRVETEAVDGVTKTYGYDPAGQLTSVTTSGGGTVSFAYDSRGRRTTKQAGGVTTTYSYDDASQLLSAAEGSTTTTYTYDPAGRRTSESGPSGSVTYTYDSAGRLSTYARAGTTQTRSYDIDSVLTSVSNTTGTTTTKTVLDWDVAGDLPQVAAIAGGASTSIVAGANGPAALRRGSASVGLASDIRGSTLSTPATSAVARSDGYDPFGVASGPSTFEPRLGYRGELVLDGLVHLRARDYQPATAAFTLVDPAEGVMGTAVIANRYHYADNDPVNQSDPTGMMTGVSAFVGFDAGMLTGGGFALFYSGGGSGTLTAPVITGGGAAGAATGAGGAAGGGVAGGAAMVGGIVAVAGVAIFGSTTGIDLPDLPGSLPDLPKICVLMCDTLEDAREGEDNATRAMAEGWQRANQRLLTNHPDEAVVIFREVGADARQDGSLKRVSQNSYRKAMRFDAGSGVSFLEQPGLKGVKRGVMPLVVHVPGGRAAAVPYAVKYMVMAPECRARYSPGSDLFHWDVDCGGDNTEEVLGDYGYMLFNPPLPNPAYRR